MSSTSFPATLEQKIAELETTRNSLVSELGDGVDIKPVSGWSIGEIAYHLYIVEKGITAMLAKALAAKENKPRKTDEELCREWQQLTSFVSNREHRIEAPSIALPNNAPELSQSLKLLHESRKALHDFLQNTNIDDLASIAIPHPVESVGILSGNGWLSLIAYHELRHVEQIKEIKQQNNN